METILFLTHTEPDGSLGRTALEALGVACTLTAALPSSKLIIGLVGDPVAGAANVIGSCGAQRFLAVAGIDFKNSRYASDALAAETIARSAQATLVIAPATVRWSRVLAGVAYRLQGCVDTHITGIQVSNGVPAVSRWYYRQRMEAVLQRSPRPWFILLDPGCGEAWQGPTQPVTVENLAVPVAPACQRTRVEGTRAPQASQQTIRPEADLLFVTGAGWTKKQADGQVHLKEAENLIADFLRLTKASLGSSKSLVDLSGEGQAVLPFLTHLNQVGQTGSTPRHPKGLATCCHGEEPHAVGWRFIKERRAINLDPNCGWARGKADVLYVADAFAVVTELNALLASK